MKTITESTKITIRNMRAVCDWIMDKAYVENSDRDPVKNGMYGAFKGHMVKHMIMALEDTDIKTAGQLLKYSNRMMDVVIQDYY